jgi:prepilin-type N-terminal cleavage/methylation domain-containing protein
MGNNRKAFTLIELMVAMGIAAVLITLSIIGIGIVQRSLRNTQRRDALNSVNLAVNSHYADNGAYPSSVTFDSVTDTAIVGSQTINLAGHLNPATQTSNAQTQYCYGVVGVTYQLGVRLEGGGQLQLGNASSGCTLAAAI